MGGLQNEPCPLRVHTHSLLSQVELTVGILHLAIKGKSRHTPVLYSEYTYMEIHRCGIAFCFNLGVFIMESDYNGMGWKIDFDQNTAYRWDLVEWHQGPRSLKLPFLMASEIVFIFGSKVIFLGRFMEKYFSMPVNGVTYLHIGVEKRSFEIILLHLHFKNIKLLQVNMSSICTFYFIDVTGNVYLDTVKQDMFTTITVHKFKISQMYKGYLTN